MSDYWRDFDLSERKRKILNAFSNGPVVKAEDVPVIVSTGNYFGFGGRPRSREYWSNPAEMLRLQTAFQMEHMLCVRDDMIPYFMPWFGTGVLASAFGCPVRHATGDSDDPAIAGPCVETPAQAARLSRPNHLRDGLMPQVLRCIDYALEHGDLPVGPSDLNSPLSTLAQICGYENLFIWMYEEPQTVHELMELVTEAFIDWVKEMKRHTGEPSDASHVLQGVWSPEGVGVWVSDDDLIAVGPDMYEEFVVPCYSRLFRTFSGGSLHFCGNGTQHLSNFRKIDGVRAINNSPMGNRLAFDTLVRGRPAGTMIQIQDNAPAEAYAYYKNLFADTDDFSGIMVATWVLDRVAMTADGGYLSVDWDPIEAANRTVTAIRQTAAERMEAVR